MKIRNLEYKDAALMLEWMHDPFVVEKLQTDFASKTLEDCLKFIRYANESTADLHFAITDDADEYMGTVSLKHIENETAEFAITIRAAAMGKGYSKWAMENILEKGTHELGLKQIYWCVDPANQRAVRFYQKNGFQQVDINNSDIRNVVERLRSYSDKQIDSYQWYAINA